jgi:hypothetical protein
MKGTMKLIDTRTGRMVCKVCGYEHNAMVKPNSNGNFYRGAWQCAQRHQH